MKQWKSLKRESKELTTIEYKTDELYEIDFTNQLFKWSQYLNIPDTMTGTGTYMLECSISINTE